MSLVGTINKYNLSFYYIYSFKRLRRDIYYDTMKSIINDKKNSANGYFLMLIISSLSARCRKFRYI